MASVNAYAIVWLRDHLDGFLKFFCLVPLLQTCRAARAPSNLVHKVGQVANLFVAVNQYLQGLLKHDNIVLVPGFSDKELPLRGLVLPVQKQNLQDRIDAL